MCGYCGCQDEKIIEIEKDILSTNQYYAERNRHFFEEHHMTALNFVSSPGSGKTSLLVKTIQSLQNDFPINVIEGDQQSDFDKKRIAQTGANVYQINTGKTCHLDAHMIEHAISHLNPQDNSFLLIENVGNLVCPAMFDLGEHSKVAILSVTEGDEKPLKYPYMFAESDLMIINKIDLLPYVQFDLAQCISYAKKVNPSIKILKTSVTSNEGFDAWIDWLKAYAKIAA